MKTAFQLSCLHWQMLKLYMPLTVNACMRNEYGDLENDLEELDIHHVLSYENRIAAELLREQLPEEEEWGLMIYYSEDDSVNRKLQSYVFKVERVGNRLMGIAECQVHEELLEHELSSLRKKSLSKSFISQRFETVDQSICHNLSAQTLIFMS